MAALTSDGTMLTPPQKKCDADNDVVRARNSGTNNILQKQQSKGTCCAGLETAAASLALDGKTTVRSDGSAGGRQHVKRLVHACGSPNEQHQRLGVQAITGIFRTVATAVAEARASIHTESERHAEGAMALWVNLRTFLDTTPLSK
jgi:hypothetical protein